MWTIPREESCVPAHETMTFLLLVVIHGLCHPQETIPLCGLVQVVCSPPGSGSVGNKSTSTVAVQPTGVEYFL